MDRQAPERGAIPNLSVCVAVGRGSPRSGQQSDPLLSVLLRRHLSNEILEHRSD
ncbi:MAG: hypothetical protein ACRELG_16945 [Gemmataceae bacterium]